MGDHSESRSVWSVNVFRSLNVFQTSSSCSPREARRERSFRERPAGGTLPWASLEGEGTESGTEVAENLFSFVASDFNPSVSELVLCLAPLSAPQPLTPRLGWEVNP